MQLPDIARRLVTLGREQGFFSVLGSAVGWAVGWFLGRPTAGRPSRRSFRWGSREVPYFHHAYNYTWLNERAVEVALALEVLDAHAGGSVLEIGNVLGHYRTLDHLVVDKYEQAPGVVNADVADFETDCRFDLILAVSTLEHVGFDESVRDPEKPARALERLRSLLAPGGRLWVTIPVDYNPDLDRHLRAADLGFTSVRALRRDDRRNRWREVPLDEVWTARYDWLLYTAHGVVVAEYAAPS